MPAVKPLYIFAGEDSYTKDAEIERLKKAVLTQGSGAFNFFARAADEDGNMEPVIEHLRSVPFAGVRKLALVKNAENLDEKGLRRLAEYMRSPPPWACLALETGKAGLPDEEGFNALTKHAETAVFGKPAGERIIPWLNAQFKIHGKAISADAAKALFMAKGQDLNALSREVEKLAAFAGDRQGITRDDVEEIVSGSVSKKAFDLVEMLRRKNAGAALALADQLLKTGKPVQELLGMIAWEYRRTGARRELRLILETDAAIKSGRVAPELAFETLIVDITSSYSTASRAARSFSRPSSS